MPFREFKSSTQIGITCEQIAFFAGRRPEAVTPKGNLVNDRS